MHASHHDELNLLQCMEVRGGHGAAANFFRRPGVDIWVWSQTRQDSKLEGGDAHYISSCASGRITRMLMADVGGTDDLFADVARRIRDLMKDNINVVSQAPAVDQMSAEMSATSQQGGFASTLLSTFFAPTRSLTICNAGHPPPLLYRSASGEWSALKAEMSELPLVGDYSGTVDPIEYQRFKLKLDIGDSFFFYSNALSECRRRDGRILGVDGIIELISQLTETGNRETSLRDFIQSIREAHPGNLRDEDATAMLGKVTKSRVAMRDNFLAPFRLLRGTSDRTVF
ncbi:MAG: serine/threonine-protein phosphatase [Pirellulaceae bacterium]|nr:serine/threonine-protein phosphatase [Pirellulaceae bacterium]